MKRTIAIALSFVMLFGAIPAGAAAPGMPSTVPAGRRVSAPPIPPASPLPPVQSAPASADVPADPRRFSRHHAPLPRAARLAHVPPVHRPVEAARRIPAAGVRLAGPLANRSALDAKPSRNAGESVARFFAHAAKVVPQIARLASRGAASSVRATSSVDTTQLNATGINHWWSYEEGALPGVGKWMVNASSQNLILQSDDMDVPYRGIDFAFRRTYNSLSNHDFAGTDGAAEVGQYGNGWTNTFDAHLSANNCPSSGYSYSGYYGFSVHDIDGARYDYCFNATGRLVPSAGMQGTSLVPSSDGGSFLWTKKSGTVYTFYAPYLGGTSAAYSGRIYRISARNQSNYIQFTYAWSPDASSSGNLTNIYVATDANLLSATLTFATFGGQRLLSQLTRPDSTVITYGYDAAGNLASVQRPRRT